MKTLDDLEHFQHTFSTMLRAPLATESHTFSPAEAFYADELCAISKPGRAGSGRTRLGIYNRQYWFRLFSTLQSEFPLSARLLGFWTFNHWAQHFLQDAPPGHWDLGRAADGFFEFLLSAGKQDWVEGEPPSRLRVPRQALCEAAALDEAWRTVWRAPQVSAFRPTQHDIARLSEGRLLPRPSVAIVQERWPLADLRRSLSLHPGEDAIPLPSPHGQTQWLALLRTPDGTLELALDAAEARLLNLLRAHQFSLALSIFEAEQTASSSVTRAVSKELAAQVQVWLQRSVALGFWAGVESQR